MISYLLVFHSTIPFWEFPVVPLTPSAFQTGYHYTLYGTYSSAPCITLSFRNSWSTLILQEPFIITTALNILLDISNFGGFFSALYLINSEGLSNGSGSDILPLFYRFSNEERSAIRQINNTHTIARSCIINAVRCFLNIMYYFWIDLHVMLLL